MFLGTELLFLTERTTEILSCMYPSELPSGNELPDRELYSQVSSEEYKLQIVQWLVVLLCGELPLKIVRCTGQHQPYSELVSCTAAFLQVVR